MNLNSPSEFQVVRVSTITISLNQEQTVIDSLVKYLIEMKYLCLILEKCLHWEVRTCMKYFMNVKNMYLSRFRVVISSTRTVRWTETYCIDSLSGLIIKSIRFEMKIKLFVLYLRFHELVWNCEKFSVRISCFHNFNETVYGGYEKS